MKFWVELILCGLVFKVFIDLFVFPKPEKDYEGAYTSLCWLKPSVII